MGWKKPPAPSGIQKWMGQAMIFGGWGWGWGRHNLLVDIDTLIIYSVPLCRSGLGEGLDWGTPVHAPLGGAAVWKNIVQGQ